MNDIPLTTFAQLIEATHNARSEIAGQVPVEHELEDGGVWSGYVLVFELIGHPTSRRCYAWEVKGRITMVLETPEVRSPIEAVQVSSRQAHA